MKTSTAWLLLLVPVLLVACGDKAESPAETSATESSPKTAGAVPNEETPRKIGRDSNPMKLTEERPQNTRKKREKYKGKTLLEEDPSMEKTASGLRYKILEKGKGDERPALGAEITARYSVYFPDGSTAFEAKRDMEFTVGNYMKAIDEGVQLVGEGGRIELHAPWFLAYGERGRGPIPAKCDLRIDLKLVSFEPGGEIAPFRKVDLEKAEKTDNGIQFETLAEGTGPTAGGDDVVVLDWHVWSMDGQIVQSSTAQPKSRLMGQTHRLPYEFAKEMAPRMRLGTKFLMVVPPELAFKHMRIRTLAPNSTSTILLECKHLITPYPPGGEPEKTENGVEIWRMQTGKGRKITPKSVLTVREVNWNNEKRIYNTSFNSGGITEYPLGALAPGKREALLTMRAGDVAFIRCPPELGYPKARRNAPANTELLFYIEVKKVRGR